MTSISLFNEIYGKHSIMNGFVIGSRTTKSFLLFYIKDEKIVDEALSKLFVECPSKFRDESKNEKHYLLKIRWDILSQLLTTIRICKAEPNESFKYIKWFIKDTLHKRSTYKFYMDPTALKEDEYD